LPQLETLKQISTEVNEVWLLLLQHLEMGRNLLGRLSRQRGKLGKLEKEELFQMGNAVCLINKPSGSVRQTLTMQTLHQSMKQQPRLTPRLHQARATLSLSGVLPLWLLYVDVVGASKQAILALLHVRHLLA
jgi:DMSO reductase anchor subunit